MTEQGMVELAERDQLLALAERATSIVETLLKLKPPSDSDGTATAAANGDLPVPQDCQARAEGIAQKEPQ